MILPSLVYAQTNKTIQKEIKIDQFTITIDSFSLIPGSLSITNENGNLIDTSKYVINEIDAKIKIIDSTLIHQVIKLEYKRYPVLLSKTFYHRKLSHIEPEKYKVPYWKINNLDNADNNQLLKEGGISRYITTGNSQDLSMISNIDLRISGKLNKNVNLQAVISDNNLPFQADGSTYKLQEFDKVYINIFNERSEIIAGDLDLKYSSKFLRYNNKAKGILYKLNLKNQRSQLSTLNSFTMSKGKYATNSFIGEEGNQGPYKLNGNNGENYIVVIAGSEKVFIDGQKQSRGVENNYIIDYNTAEIIFTHETLITKNKRIYVEFEYNDKSYAQSTINSHFNIQNNKASLSLDIFSQTDWKHHSYLNNLSNNDKETISNNGDYNNDIFSNSIDSVSFSENKVLYKRMDTIIQGIDITYYKFSINSDSAHYQIEFIQVEQNKGNYILSEEGTNGRIYKWVPPAVNNNQLIPQGNYSPKNRLISPKSKTIISATVDYKLSKKFSINTSLAVENRDENLFSKIDDDDNLSIASHVSIKSKILSHQKIKINTTHSFEYISNNFNGANRFQDIEFNRDWSIDSLNSSHLFSSNNVVFQWINNDILNYKYEALWKGDKYKAEKNNINLNFNNENIDISFKASHADINSTSYIGRITQIKNHIKNKFKKIDLSIHSNAESIIRYDGDNNLLLNSASHIEMSSIASHSNGIFKLEFINRKDKKPMYSSMDVRIMDDYSNSHDINIKFSSLENKNTTYKSSMSFRSLKYVPDSISNEETILSKNSIRLSRYKNSINLNIDYEVGKGKQASKEKSYIKVPSGMGSYSWIDNNNNGIQELSEFVVSVFQDEAEYVPLFLPSNKLEDIYVINYHQNIQVDLKRILKSKFFKKINLSSEIQVKNKNKSKTKIYNPFSNENIDSCMNYTLQNINSLIYNKFSNNFSFQIINKRIINQNSFSYGSDRQENYENHFKCNLIYFDKVKNDISIKLGKNKHVSSFFSDRNFSYRHQVIINKLVWLKSSKQEWAMQAEYKLKTPLFEMHDEAHHNMRYLAGIISYKYSDNQKNLIELNNQLVNINFNKTNNNILNYDLMEGLNSGFNIIIGVNYKRQLKNQMEISLSYSSRKSQESKLKHIGNIGIQAFF